MHPTRIALRSIAALLVLATGCTSSTEPDTATVLQSFDLATVDAAALPELVLQEYDYDLWVNSETIEIRDDGRVKFLRTTVRVLVSPPPAPRTIIASMPPAYDTFRRPFVIEGDSIKIYASSTCTTSGCELEARGTLIGSTLQLIRPNWSAFALYDYSETPVVP